MPAQRVKIKIILLKDTIYNSIFPQVPRNKINKIYRISLKRTRHERVKTVSGEIDHADELEDLII